VIAFASLSILAPDVIITFFTFLVMIAAVILLVVLVWQLVGASGFWRYRKQAIH
jgi:hypothetical protein